MRKPRIGEKVRVTLANGVVRTARLDGQGKDSGGPWALVVMLHGGQAVLVHPDRVAPHVEATEV